MHYNYLCIVFAPILIFVSLRPYVPGRFLKFLQIAVHQQYNTT